MKKYDLFLFDADNTLYDYDKAESCALKATFAHYGLQYCENVLAMYRKINSQAWLDYEGGKISKDTLQTSRFERLFQEIGVQYDAGSFNTIYTVELGKGAYLIEGALEVCKEIATKGKDIFIITNGVLVTQKSRIKHSLIKEYIADIFVSEFVGFNKPDIRYFEYVLANIPQIPKEKILIIGDSLTADIAGGCNADIDSCWFNEHGVENVTGIKPTYEICKLEEVLGFV